MSASISIQPVIMAGGNGTRLWPLSRSGFPKQFLALAGDDSLFQQAVMRLRGLAALTASLQKAVRFAAEGAIVILGITPDRPETGYGYIRSIPGQGCDKV